MTIGSSSFEMFFLRAVSRTEFRMVHWRLFAFLHRSVAQMSTESTESPNEEKPRLFEIKATLFQILCFVGNKMWFGEICLRLCFINFELLNAQG